MLPYMSSAVKKARKSINVFGGINRTASKKDGELAKCKNTSGKKYPALSSVPPRMSPLETGVKINGAGSKNGLFYTGVASSDHLTTNIYFEKKVCALTTATGSGEAERKRSFALQGDSVLIIPDNKVYSTADNSVYTVEYSKNITLSQAIATAKQECNTTSTYNARDYIGEITPGGIVSTSMSENGYISYFMTFSEIKKGDIIYLSMDVSPKEYEDEDDHYYEYIDKMKEGVYLKVAGVNRVSYKTAMGNKTAYAAVYFDENALDMGGYSVVVINSITLRREMPPLEHICSLNNRVWGVYGNTIHCSKLGDCSQWYDFSADAYGTLPSSSFSTDVDSPGSFTGIIPYGGGVVAFKENCLHRIYGSEPDSYTLSTLDCAGVKAGCGNTLALINGTVYYMGRDGVYAYRGTMPELVSKKPDLSDIEPVCAATDGTNYYLIADEGGKRVLYVYYPLCKIWHMEDIDPTADILTADGGCLYAIAEDRILCLSGREGTDLVEWSFSLDIDNSLYNTCSYSRLLINYSLEKNGEYSLKIFCDGDPRPVTVLPEFNHKENAYSVIPLPYMGCRDFRIEFEGRGAFTLKNITAEYIVTPEEKGNYI